MKAKELDVVELKDGRTGTLVHAYPDGETFMLEISDGDGKTLDSPYIKQDDIARITYTA